MEEDPLKHRDPLDVQLELHNSNADAITTNAYTEAVYQHNFLKLLEEPDIRASFRARVWERLVATPMGAQWLQLFPTLKDTPTGVMFLNNEEALATLPALDIELDYEAKNEGNSGIANHLGEIRLSFSREKYRGRALFLMQIARATERKIQTLDFSNFPAYALLAHEAEHVATMRELTSEYTVHEFNTNGAIRYLSELLADIRSALVGANVYSEHELPQRIESDSAEYPLEHLVLQKCPEKLQLLQQIVVAAVNDGHDPTKLFLATINHVARVNQSISRKLLRALKLDQSPSRGVDDIIKFIQDLNITPDERAEETLYNVSASRFLSWLDIVQQELLTPPKDPHFFCVGHDRLLVEYNSESSVRETHTYRLFIEGINRYIGISTVQLEESLLGIDMFDRPIDRAHEVPSNLPENILELVAEELRKRNLYEGKQIIPFNSMPNNLDKRSTELAGLLTSEQARI